LTIVLLLLVLAGFAYWRPEVATTAVERASMRAAGIHSESVQLGPYRIHYLVAGEGRPLVLVHGLGGRAEEWAPLMAGLAKQHYRVYAPDLLGYGRSDKPDVDYTIESEVRIVQQFMDSQKLEQPDLGGWSMGGWIVLQFALEHPGRARRLMVFDSAGMKFQPTVDLALLRPHTPAQLNGLVKILFAHPPQMADFFARGILRQTNQVDWVVGRALDNIIAGKELLDGKLGPVSVPVLIVWGKQDVLTPLSVGQAMQREMPQSRLEVFDDCAHMTPLECSDRVVPEVARFLQSDPPEPAGTEEIPAVTSQR
jgi:pimeloyl-ACP methyl ester carboxylesterase